MHPSTCPHASRAVLALAFCLFTSACSRGGGGGSAATPPPAFLSIDSRVETDTPGAHDSSEPRVLATDSGLYAVWIDERLGSERLFTNRSTDFGQTWGASDVEVPMIVAAADYIHDFPKEAFHAVGSTLYVVAEVDEDIHFNRSTDGGLTWLSAPIRLDTDAVQVANSDEPNMAVEGQNVYVVWTDDRDGDEDVRFNRSTDGGLTWLAADVRLDTDHPGDYRSVEARIAAAPGGLVFVTWTDDRNGPDQKFANVSTDFGATWLASDFRVADTNTGSADSEDLHVRLSGSTLHLTWIDDRTGSEKVYYNRSTDNGQTWLPDDLRLDDTSSGVDCEDVEIAVDGAGVHVVWQAKQSGEDDIFYRGSNDAGVTWSASVERLDTDPAGVGDADDPEIVAVGSSVVVCWEDDRNGFDDIYINYSRDGGATWQADDLRVDTKSKAGAKDADDPQVAASSQGVWIVWPDYRNGAPDIRANGGALP